jgi:PAS domain S-box-containing protein
MPKPRSPHWSDAEAVGGESNGSGPDAQLAGQLLESWPDPVTAFDEQQRLVYANIAAKRAWPELAADGRDQRESVGRLLAEVGRGDASVEVPVRWREEDWQVRAAPTAGRVTLLWRRVPTVSTHALEPAAVHQEFWQLLEAAPFSAQLVEASGRTLRVNRAWEALWGAKFEQLAEYNLLQDQQLEALGVLPRLRRAFAGEAVELPPVVYNPAETLPELEAGTDRRRYVSAVAYPLFDDAGVVGQVVLVHHDITDRMLAEEALRRSELQLRQALAAAELIVWDMDPHSGVVTCSEAARRLWGVVQAPAKAFFERVHPHDRTMVEQAYAESAARQDKPLQFEYRIFNPAGEVRWLNSRGMVLRDQDGRPVRFVGVSADVTDRRRDEEALERASAEHERARVQLETVVNTMTDGLLVLDGTGQLVLMNPAALRMHGYGEGPKAGEHLRHFAETFEVRDVTGQPVPPEQWPAARALRGETVQAVEYRVVRKDTQVQFTALYSAAPIRSPDGAVEIVVVSVNEITQRRRAEEEAHRLAGIVEATTDFVAVADLSGRILYLNRAGRTMLGLPSPESLAELNHGRLCPPWVIERAHREWLPTALQQGSAYGEGALLAADGREIPVSFVLLVHRDAAGRAHSISTVARDISVRKQVEKSLRDSNDRLQRAQQAARLGMWEWDLEQNTVLWSDGTYELLGLVPGAIDPSDGKWTQFVHPDDRENVLSSVQHYTGTGGSFAMEYRVNRVDGAMRWIQSIGRVELGPQATARRMIGVNIDITTQKEVEEKLRAARDQLVTALQAKDQFLAALSHELRTPLTPVLMSAAVLREDARLPEDVRKELAMMERNVALEARLIDDLLDLTRIARGKLTLREERCELSTLLRYAEEMVHDEALEKQVELKMGFEEPLPIVRADAARLQQVFWNLLRNAVKFTPAGGVIQVTCRQADEKDRVEVRVQDSGAGFAPEEAERIFEPFEQGLSGRQQAGGLGLGLAIARGIVNLHGGRLTASSAGLGRGAEFVVALPIEETASSPSPLPATAQPTVAAAGGTSVSLQVLLVEDHASTREVLSRVLARAGHTVVPADRVGTALMAAQQQRFDLVISDIGLPDGTGLELMSRLRDHFGLRGVALSGYGTDEDMRASREAGFVAHLIKPVDLSALRRLLEQLAAAP